jgi:ferredoxin
MVAGRSDGPLSPPEQSDSVFPQVAPGLPVRAPTIGSGTVRIMLDTMRCTGHGRCYSLAPELFDSDEYGHSILRTPDVPIGLESQAQLAVESCPESCLRLE